MKRNRIFQKGTLAAASGLLLCAAAAAGCASHRGDASSEPAVSAGSPSVPPGGTIAGGSPQVASPPVLIYKTRKDYSHNVPVIMDASRRRIVSYPAPSDHHGDILPIHRSPTPGSGFAPRYFAPPSAYIPSEPGRYGSHAWSRRHQQRSPANDNAGKSIPRRGP